MENECNECGRLKAADHRQAATITALMKRADERSNSVLEYLDCLVLHLPEKRDPHINHFVERIRGWCGPSVNLPTNEVDNG